jgi:exopolysaccharide biosynthesis polyprenyl glycosylphosphotransferase
MMAPSLRLSARRQRFLLIAADVAVLILFMIVWEPQTLGYDLLGLLILIFFRWQAGLYRARFHVSALDEIPKALIACFVASGVFAFMAAMPRFDISIDDVVWVSFAGVMLSLLRVLVYALLRDLRRNEVARERLLLVGSGVIADAISEMAEGNPSYGLDLVSRAPDLIDTDLVEEARASRASTVLIAFSRASESREVFEIRRGLAAGLRIMAVPRYFDLVGDSKADDVIFGLPVVRLGATQHTLGLRVKRFFDIVLAGASMVVFAPILAIAGPLLKRETGGDLLFRQVRIGKDGRQFELLKLQTMKPVTESTSNTTWTVTPESDRLGPIGKFLRKTSLDELPQLWNILRGDMSFVGPRPERPFFVEQFTEQYPHYEDRHRMTAGLTGLAQIYDLRGDTSIDDRARFDNRYADHWSLWGDVKIILKTVPKVFKGSGG